jgi:hypothetical protein
MLAGPGARANPKFDNAPLLPPLTTLALEVQPVFSRAGEAVRIVNHRRST